MIGLTKRMPGLTPTALSTVHLHINQRGGNFSSREGYRMLEDTVPTSVHDHNTPHIK